MSLALLALLAAGALRFVLLDQPGLGVAAAGPARTGGALRQWLDRGLHGEMAYLDRTRDVRDDPTHLLPGCRSLVAVADLGVIRPARRLTRRHRTALVWVWIGAVVFVRLCSWVVPAVPSKDEGSSDRDNVGG